MKNLEYPSKDYPGGDAPSEVVWASRVIITLPVNI